MPHDDKLFVIFINEGHQHNKQINLHHMALSTKLYDGSSIYVGSNNTNI